MRSFRPIPVTRSTGRHRGPAAASTTPRTHRERSHGNVQPRRTRRTRASCPVHERDSTPDSPGSGLDPRSDLVARSIHARTSTIVIPVRTAARYPKPQRLLPKAEKQVGFDGRLCTLPCSRRENLLRMRGCSHFPASKLAFGIRSNVFCIFRTYPSSASAHKARYHRG